MQGRLAHVWYVTLDCRDPDALAAFWSELLGLPVHGTFGDAFVMLERPADDAVAMAFQRVPEPKAVKNRCHVDLRVDDLQAVTELVESRGGSRLADHDEESFRWRVMRDPEGNEFCLMPSGQS
ncbi:MAG: VOC family protein [Actinobacteria bacterium]|nr:VOC family protein [Actinomycetota bacterium]